MTTPDCHLPARISALLTALALASCGTASPSTGALSDAAVVDTSVADDSGGLLDANAADTTGADTTAADTVDPCPEGLPCDDGDPCSVESFCKSGTCVAGKASFCSCQNDGDCAASEDGDLCNGTLYCDTSHFPYACVVKPSTIVTCNADDPACQATACDPATGACSVTNVKDGVICDDTDPCTEAGACKAGACQLGANTCACKADSDCAAKEDGDLCNGTLYCDVTSSSCKVNPATIVDCPSADDTDCSKNACSAKSGQCEFQPVLNNTACQDGDSCTEGDHCTLGVCVSGTNTCLCTTDADCEAQYGDGDFCDGTMFCNKVNGLCQVNPNTIISCPTVNDTACRKAQCANVFEDVGGVPLAKSASCVMVDVADGLKQVCDDGNKCTTGDTCIGGVCTPSANTCKCKIDLDCEAEEDGDKCNGTLFCNQQTGGCELNPATVVTSCPTVDDSACEKRACVPKTGLCELKPEPENKPCDDGNTCTSGDVCAAGACVGLFVCECKDNADCAKHEDGDFCNGTLACDKQLGKCVLNPASVVVCDPSGDTACKKATCAPLTGACYLAAQSTQTTCEDGDACTVGDLCNGKGGCKSGTDVCECHSAADCVAKDDGNFCNGVPYCDASTPGKNTCKPNPASVIVCPNVDDSACIRNTCDAKTGACHLAKLATGTACDDGDLCTSSTACDDGSCVGGTYTCACASNADCIATDDGDLCNGVPYCDTSSPGKHVCKPNPASAIFCPQNVNTQCLQNTCNPKDGKCGLQPFGAGKSCDDGDACTSADGCAQGACVGGGKTDCDDGNACTTDACDAKTGCTHLNENCDDGNTCTVDKCDPKTGKCDFATQLQDGAACNADANGCTLNDTCDKGACFAGVQVKCELGGGPCDLSVCQSVGPIQYKCLLASKKDGEACDDGQICTLGTICKQGQCLSSGTERLWTAKNALSGNGDFTYRAVGVLGDRIIVAGNAVVRDGKGAATARRIDLEAWTLGHELAWAATETADDASGVTRAVEILVQDAKVGMVIGQTYLGGQDRLLAWRFDGDGKTLSVVRSAVYDSITPEAAVSQSDGNVWVIGEASDKDAARVFLVRLSSTGQLAFKHRFDTLIGAEGHAIAELPGAQFVIAGATADLGKGLNYGLLLRTDADGKVLWQRTVQQDKQPTELFAARTSSSGAITLAGHSKKGANWYGLLVRTDGDGNEIWRRTTLNTVRIFDLQWLASGKLLVAGAQQDAGIGDIAWLGMFDPVGNVIWQRPLTVIDGKPVVDQARILGMSAHGDGFALAGELTAAGGTKTSGFIGRVAGFGFSTCGSAGACAGKSADGCDDGAPCTLDLCDTTSGKCVHSQLNGLVCDPEDGCTTSGACEAGKCVLDPNGVLWTRNFAWEDVKAGPTSVAKGAARLLATADGGTIVFGHWQDDKGATGELRKLDASGQIAWTLTLTRPLGFFAAYNDKVMTADRVGTLRERANGEIWLDVREPTATTVYWKTHILRATADGDALADLDWSYPDSASPELLTAMVEHPDGSTVVAQRNNPSNNSLRKTRFVRRDKDFQVVAESSGIYLINELLAGPQLETYAIAADIYESRCELMRFGPSGLPLYQSAAIAPVDYACGSVTRTACVTGRLQDGELTLVQNELCVKGPTTTVWRFSRFEASTGKLLGVRDLKPQGGDGYNYGSWQILPGPRNGFAIVEHNIKPVIAQMYLTDLWGNLRLTRPLPYDASYFATAFAASDDHVIWGGKRVDSDGTTKTGVTHTGPWGYGSCSDAGLCKGEIGAGGCDDGDACTADSCAADKGCGHAPQSCDDGNWCTADSCDKTGGCVHKTLDCVDGDLCTQDLCNVLVAGADGKTGCAHPLVAVCVDGAKCTDDVCDSKTGACSHPMTVCDDGEPCTWDNCSPAFGCQSGAVTCNDDDPCTFDQCIKGKGCAFTPLSDGANCEDGTFCKLGKGVCSAKGCSVAGVGVPIGCSALKPTQSCTATLAEGNGKLDAYVGPVWFDVAGDGKKITQETCDMKAGGFWRRTERSEMLGTTSIAPGELSFCAGVGPTYDESFGWLAPAVQNTPGKLKLTVPVSFEVAVPTPHVAVRIRLTATGSGGYSALKDTLKLRIQLDGKVAYEGLYGGFPNATWAGADGENSNSQCDGMNKTRHQVIFDVQAAHTAAKLTIALSMSSDQDSFNSRHIFHHVEVWTK